MPGGTGGKKLHKSKSWSSLKSMIYASKNEPPASSLDLAKAMASDDPESRRKRVAENETGVRDVNIAAQPDSKRKAKARPSQYRRAYSSVRLLLCSTPSPPNALPPLYLPVSISHVAVAAHS